MSGFNSYLDRFCILLSLANRLGVLYALRGGEAPHCGSKSSVRFARNLTGFWK